MPSASQFRRPFGRKAVSRPAAHLGGDESWHDHARSSRRRNGHALAIGLCAGLAVFAASEARAAYSCSVTPTDILFGTVAPLLPSAVDSTGTITIVCTPSGKGAEQVSYTISLGAGTSGDAGNRQMASGANRLRYNLYQTSARTQVWGDSASGEGVSDGYRLSSGGASESRSYTVYGRIPGSQTSAVPGLYQDTITVRVDF